MEEFNKYRLTQFHQAREDFREIFNVGLNDFIDKFMSASVGDLVLDIPMLHVRLLKENSDYENRSFDDLIFEKYGEKGQELIKKLTL